MPTQNIAAAIRDAAKRCGGLERFRRRYHLPNTTFYALLRGKLPAKTATLRALDKKLSRAGITTRLLLA